MICVRWRTKWEKKVCDFDSVILIEMTLCKSKVSPYEFAVTCLHSGLRIILDKWKKCLRVCQMYKGMCFSELNDRSSVRLIFKRNKHALSKNDLIEINGCLDERWTRIPFHNICCYYWTEHIRNRFANRQYRKTCMYYCCCCCLFFFSSFIKLIMAITKQRTSYDVK